MPRLVAIVSLLLGGCVAEVGFDPVGDAASVEGAWTLGGVPAGDASCQALGASYVRVRFFRGEDYRDHSRLVFPCAQGAFDTRPDRRVAEGSWDMALIAIDADGQELATGPTETHEAAENMGHIVLGAADLVAAP